MNVNDATLHYDGKSNMTSTISVTIIVDNISTRPDLKAEHGLSIWIETDDRRILFDAGQSDILLENAQRLGIDLSTTDTIILSHGHYDHTGGLAQLLEANPDAKVYCHADIFVSRYSRQDDGKMKQIGINERAYESLHKFINRIQLLHGPFYLSDTIGITGPVPRISDFETTGGDFYFDLDACKPDLVEDDLALWIKTESGLCVVCGCCHSGLVNTLRHISQIDELQVHTVIGGFHLLHASATQMDKTCAYLNSINIEQIIPCHCTGEKKVEKMKTVFGKKVIPGYAGKNIVI